MGLEERQQLRGMRPDDGDARTSGRNLEGALDDGNGAFDAGTETSGCCQQDIHAKEFL